MGLTRSVDGSSSRAFSPLAFSPLAFRALARPLHVGTLRMDQPNDASPEQQAETRTSVRSGLEDAFALIETPQQAEAVVTHLEQAAAGTTEQAQGEAASRQPQAPGERVVQSTERGDRPPSERSAAAIVAAASEAIAPTPTAPAVVDAAREAAGTHPPTTVQTDRARVRVGRQHLKEAVLRRMPAWQRLDARAFLTLNQA